MNRRLLYGLLGLLVLGSLAGCTAITGVTSEAGLQENQSYDWDTETDVVIDLGDDSYQAVHEIDNRSEIRLYQSTRYGTENPISVRALQFRHDNGSVVNASAMTVSESRSSVDVELPAENGQFAYTAPKRSKEFSTPVFTPGSYTVKVPPGHNVENFVLGTVRPRGSDRTMVDDRVHITWDDLSSGSIEVSYYLTRDVYLFGGLIATAGIAGAIGLGYVYRQIRQLQREREELGLDIDVDDDSSGGPPPGMR